MEGAELGFEAVCGRGLGFVGGECVVFGEDGVGS